MTSVVQLSDAVEKWMQFMYDKRQNFKINMGDD